MRTRHPFLNSAVLGAALAVGAAGVRADDAAAPASRESEESEPTRDVDLAICLDTSGSMQNLIDAARQRIWSIVNELAQARPSPRLRVAVLSYGNDGHPREDAWVRVETGLTDDLDLVSQRLFALSTNGGQEYVGRVVRDAVTKLDWSSGPGALRLIVVAGNESADQGDLPVPEACKAAIEREILVNALHCAPPGHADEAGWRRVAQLADGRFAAIDASRPVVAVATPFDARLAELGAALNSTYVPLGDRGRDGARNQVTQDANAAEANAPAAAGRAAAKATSLYRCAWDLVDASAEEGFDLAQVARADLPEDLRELDDAALRRRIEELRARRGELRAEIQALDARRRQHLEEAARDAGPEGAERSFDRAVREAIRDQARSRGFTFE